MKKIKTILSSICMSVIVFMSVGFISSEKVHAAQDHKKHIIKKKPSHASDVSDDSSEHREADETNNGNAVSYGAAHYENQNFKDLKVYGPATLIKVKVVQSIAIYGPLTGSDINTKVLNVNGPIEITGLNAETMEVNGPVSLKNAHINGDSAINGPLRAYGSTFNGTVKIAADVTELKDSKASTLYFRKNSSFSTKTLRVFLRGQTVVKNIFFERDGGEVIIQNPAIVQGEVRGGKIIHEK